MRFGYGCWLGCLVGFWFVCWCGRVWLFGWGWGACGFVFFVCLFCVGLWCLLVLFGSCVLAVLWLG